MNLMMNEKSAVDDYDYDYYDDVVELLRKLRRIFVVLFLTFSSHSIFYLM
jgi:hypothetical protein